ncbi:MAG TPA: hypothetical protein VHN98_06385 [Acidimicrobiales bacterium]|nr:hypothetical protein [Acidimicrobiales bacterium]
MTAIRPAFAPWDERETPRILSADDAARRCRIFAEVERRLSTLLEQWAEVVEEPHARGTLTRHARNHAWHAELWDGVMSDATEPSDGTIPDDAVANFMELVAQPQAPEELIELLAGVYRVLLPRKITAYTYYQRAIGSGADADNRWLDIILKDEFDSVRDGELLLQSLLAGEAEARRAADRRAVLESLIVKAGGLAGPGTLGEI